MRLRKRLPIDVDHAVPDLDSIERRGNNTLDETLRAVQVISEDHYIAAFDRLKVVHKYIDEDSFRIGE